MATKESKKKTKEAAGPSAIFFLGIFFGVFGIIACIAMLQQTMNPIYIIGLCATAIGGALTLFYKPESMKVGYFIPIALLLGMLGFIFMLIKNLLV